MILKDNCRALGFRLAEESLQCVLQYCRDFDVTFIENLLTLPDLFSTLRSGSPDVLFAGEDCGDCGGSPPPVIRFLNEDILSLSALRTRTPGALSLPLKPDRESFLCALAFAVAGAEKSRRSSQYDALLRTIPAAVYFKNSDLVYVAANQGFADLVGLPPEEIPGKSDHDFFSWDMAEQYRLDDLEVIVKEKPKYNIDEVITGYDGKSRWMSTSKVPYKDDQGRTAGMVGISVDISRRKELEQRLAGLTRSVLQFSSDCFENIRSLGNLCMETFQAASAFYTRADTPELFFRGRNGWKEINGGTGNIAEALWEEYGEITGNDVLFITDAADSDFLRQAEKLFPERKHVFLGKPVRFGDTTAAFFGLLLSDTYTPAETDLQFLGIIVSAMATEEQRRRSDEQLVLEREKARSASRAKSEFIANISHELRTPLNGILGYAQILRQTGPETMQHGIEVIEKSAYHLQQLIEDILDVSKIEAGKISFEPVEFRFLPFLDDIADFFAPKIEQKGLVLRKHFDTRLPGTVHFDQKRLRQVLFNILGNAVKFTGRGRIDFSVFPEDDAIRFSVSDTGCGIARESLDEVFAPFAQLRNKNGSAEGTGLGLYITKKVLAAIGSDISLNSAPGRGSTFSFDLKLTDRGGDAETGEAGGAAEETGERICGVDFCFPGQGALQELYSFASIGDVKGLREALQTLLDSDPALGGFTEICLNYLKDYNIEEARAFILQCLI